MANNTIHDDWGRNLQATAKCDWCSRKKTVLRRCNICHVNACKGCVAEGCLEDARHRVPRSAADDFDWEKTKKHHRLPACSGRARNRGEDGGVEATVTTTTTITTTPSREAAPSPRQEQPVPVEQPSATQGSPQVPCPDDDYLFRSHGHSASPLPGSVLWPSPYENLLFSRHRTGGFNAGRLYLGGAADMLPFGGHEWYLPHGPPAPVYSSSSGTSRAFRPGPSAYHVSGSPGWSDHPSPPSPSRPCAVMQPSFGGTFEQDFPPPGQHGGSAQMPCWGGVCNTRPPFEPSEAQALYEPVDVISTTKRAPPADEMVARGRRGSGRPVKGCRKNEERDLDDVSSDKAQAGHKETSGRRQVGSPEKPPPKIKRIRLIITASKKVPPPSEEASHGKNHSQKSQSHNRLPAENPFELRPTRKSLKRLAEKNLSDKKPAERQHKKSSSRNKLYKKHPQRPRAQQHQDNDASREVDKEIIQAAKTLIAMSRGLHEAT